MSDLLKCGIYVIINKNKNIVYVGQTQESFLIRWSEHLRRMEKYVKDLHRFQLYLDENTQYLIVKKLDKENGSLQFFEFENEAIDFYEKRGWLVVSERMVMKTKRDIRKSDSTRRYKEMLKHMISFLGSVDVKENYVGKLYFQVYRKINKEFSTDVRARTEEGSAVDALKIEELEFVILDLYPRYRVKKISVTRKNHGY